MTTAKPKKTAASPVKAAKTGKIVKKKEMKKTKDPNKPKRPMSAYLLFCNSIRAAEKATNPNMGFGEFGKHLSEKWKVVKESDKKKFEKQAEEEKKRYETAMKSYTASA